jgi:hypothetical protein
MLQVSRTLTDKVNEDESSESHMRHLDGSHASPRSRCGVVAASRRRCGVAASLRQVHGSQSPRRRGLKSTVENGTGRRRGLSNSRRVAVARHARLWSAPARDKNSTAVTTVKGVCCWNCYFLITYKKLECNGCPNGHRRSTVKSF